MLDTQQHVDNTHIPAVASILMSNDTLNDVRGTICHGNDDTGWMAGHLIWEHRGVHDTQAFDAVDAELRINDTFTGTRSDLCCSNLNRTRVRADQDNGQ